MWWLAAAVGCLVLGLTTSDRGYLCPITAPNPTVMQRLRNNIFCQYDRSVPPRDLNTTDPIPVTLRLDPVYIEVNERANSFTLLTWVTLEWRDEFLTWKPAEYEHQDRLQIPVTNLWYPRVELLNGVHDQDVLGITLCTLFATGQVKCVDKMSPTIFCQLELTDWPQDRHQCHVYVAEKPLDGIQKLQLAPASHSVGFGAYHENRAWEVLYDGVIDVQPGYIKYTLAMTRLGASHRAALVIPTIVVSGLVLMSYWVPGPRGGSRRLLSRVSLCCSALLLDLLLLQYAGFVAPPSGDSTPNIVRFYRDALGLAGVSVLVAFLHEMMEKRVSEIPLWTRRMLESAPVRWLLQREQQPCGPWSALAALADQLVFLVMLVVHLVLINKVAPRSYRL